MSPAVTNLGVIVGEPSAAARSRLAAERARKEAEQAFEEGLCAAERAMILLADAAALESLPPGLRDRAKRLSMHIGAEAWGMASLSQRLKG